MCTMADIKNGVYTLADIERMNQAMAEMLESTIAARERAIQAANKKPR